MQHEFAEVLAAEQHTERGGRVMEAVEDVEALTQAPVAMLGGEPGAGFLVTVVVAEYLEPLHAPASGR